MLPLNKCVKTSAILLLAIFLSACTPPQDTINKPTSNNLASTSKETIKNNPINQLNANFSIRNNQVYYQDQQISSADATSFKVIDGRYSSDGKTIFHKNNPAKDIDPSKFSVLGGTEFSTDGDYFYHPEYPSGTLSKIKIDKKSDEIFEIFGKVFAKYNGIVYCGAYIIESADADSFSTISTYYAKDKNAVYTAECNTIEALSPNDTEIIKEAGRTSYIKDKNNVFFFGQKINSANPATFEVLGDGYSKDINNVFYNQINETPIILEADPVLFEVLSNGYSKDANNFYLNGNKISKKQFDTINNE